MGIFSIAAAILIFPLNFILPLYSYPHIGQAQTSSEVEYSESQVKGVEQERKDNEIFLESVLPVAVYQPVRKENSFDIAVPDAHAFLVLDADSGAILHEKNANEKKQVASLTKIMTAVLIIENVEDLQEDVTITKEALYIPGTTIGCPRSGYCIGQRLVEGEKISVENLLKAMLMNSTNDAATALAIHIGESQDKFVEMMNEKARSLGLKNTNFCTPSGLEIDGEEESCYSTAYDIGEITAYSLNYEVIWDMMKIPEADLYSSDGKYQHHVGNTNRLLNEMEGMIGAKTGFTPMAGYSLLMSACDQSGKHKIITVILDDPYRWNDAEKLISWAYKNYSWK